MGLVKYNDISYGGGGGGDVSLEIIAESFDSTNAYNVGDIVVYNGKLYEFTSEHVANTPWDINEVAEKTVGEELENIKSTRPTAVILSQAQYDALTPAEKADTSKIYYVYDAQTAASGLVIDDNVTSRNSLWSSQKISDEIAGGGGGAVIDDTTTALDKTWSSSKINTELEAKADSSTLDDYVQTSQLGVDDGVATLDSNGQVPTSQIPSLSAQDIADINDLIDD